MVNQHTDLRTSNPRGPLADFLPQVRKLRSQSESTPRAVTNHGLSRPSWIVETQQFTNGLPFCSNRGLRAGRFCQKEGIFPHRIALGNHSGIKGVSRQSTCTAEVRSPRQRRPSTSRSSGVNPLSPDRALMISSLHVDTCDPLRCVKPERVVILRSRPRRSYTA